MAPTAEERQASNIDALTAPEQATPGAAVLPCRPVLVAILDSGATIHVVSHWQFLSNIRYLRDPVPISVADGRQVYAYDVGDIDTEDIKLKNVYLVPELKMNLVSVRELAKIGIITTFYKNHAELCKGAELVGGAIAEGNKSLYQLTYLWATGDGDASNTMPEVPSGSEPGKVAAVDGSNLPHLEEVLHLKSPLDGHADVWAKYYMSQLLKSRLDDTAFPIRECSQYLSKFYQGDETGGECCINKFEVQAEFIKGVSVNAHEIEFIKGVGVTADEIEFINGLSVNAHETGGGECCNNKLGVQAADFIKGVTVNAHETGGGECCNNKFGVQEAEFIKSLED